MDFEQFFLKLKKWENCGYKTLNNGARLICRVPHIANQAWFHIVYAPKKPLSIQELERKLGFSFPEDLKVFYTNANGCNIFSDSLSIWGIRDSYSRNVEESFQPYDLYYSNKDREVELPNEYFIFGSYNWDGSLMIYDRKKNEVFRCDRDNLTPLQEWSNIWIWLESEVDRLSLLFNENGVEYDENQPTTP